MGGYVRKHGMRNRSFTLHGLRQWFMPEGVDYILLIVDATRTTCCYSFALATSMD